MTNQFRYFLQIGFFAALIVAGIYFLLFPNDVSDMDLSSNVVDSDQLDAKVTSVYQNNILQQQGLSTNPEDSICSAKAGSVEFTTSVDMSSITWVHVGNMLVPQSEIYGPFVSESSSFSRCYQFSTQGVAFAAINYLSALQFQDLRAELFKYSAVSDQRLYNDNRHEIDGLSRFLEVQYVGYKITSEYVGATTVDVVIRIPQSNSYNYNHLSVPLKWSLGDWKLMMRDGKISTTLQPLSSLNGYIKLVNIESGGNNE